MTISFRQLDLKDMQLLLEWLQRPHVKEWWDDGDDTLEKVSAHYTSDSDTTKRYLLLSGDKERIPVGYFQYYFTAQGIGIDQFIADATLLDKGIGSDAIRKFIDMIRKEHNPSRLLTDPSPANKRAIRCYEKVGFKHTESVVDKKGALVYLMEIKN